MIRFSATAAMLALLACEQKAVPKTEDPPSAPQPALSLDEVEARLGTPGVYVFDANPRDMYDRAHVPGAKWVDFDKVSATDLPSDKQASLIFYCANEWCTASHESAKLASALGYAKVYLMPRGIIGWKKAGKRVEAAK